MRSPLTWKWIVLIILVVIAAVLASLLGGWTWDDGMLR